ncbi:MAG: hypothetical protein VR70_17850 [Rhodospirillaceae bacterium BRH_c57]|nr:MAG: hypothetical protein VR70_17850 [Rhodospirillaceae bacterium BRH_c57]
MTDSPRRTGLDAYLSFWESLRPDRIDGLEAVTTEDVRFTDPFNDVQGRDALRGVLDHMFANTRDPRFAVTDHAWAGDTAFVRWRFTATVKSLGDWDVVGMSALDLDALGRVSRHIDYWDSGPAVWLRLPFIGSLLRRIARRLGTGRQW